MQLAQMAESTESERLAKEKKRNQVRNMDRVLASLVLHPQHGLVNIVSYRHSAMGSGRLYTLCSGFQGEPVSSPSPLAVWWPFHGIRFRTTS